LSSSAQPLESAAGKNRHYGTGRRKTSVARVFISPGSGKFEVNGRAVNTYFKNVNWLTRAVEPLKFTGTESQIDVWATANGGGPGGQSGAVRMGLSRALSIMNPDLRPGLRKNGFLTRDSRRRERKKYGRKGARKRFQFSKR
jgi:small subunit ribosomal protein S9